MNIVSTKLNCLTNLFAFLNNAMKISLTGRLARVNGRGFLNFNYICISANGLLAYRRPEEDIHVGPI